MDRPTHHPFAFPAVLLLLSACRAAEGPSAAPAAGGSGSADSRGLSRGFTSFEPKLGLPKVPR